jgi:hypothetical protein
MKRRTLLSRALWSSILAFVAPAGAASAIGSNQQVRPKDEEDGAISPYDAVEAVYESFQPIGSSSELVLEDNHNWAGRSRAEQAHLRCRLVEKDEKFEYWLCFYDSRNNIWGSNSQGDGIIKGRELHVVSVPVDCNAGDSTSTGARNYIDKNWFLNAGGVVSVSAFECRDETKHCFRTSPIEKVRSHKGVQSRINAQARFLALVTE